MMNQLDGPKPFFNILRSKEADLIEVSENMGQILSSNWEKVKKQKELFAYLQASPHWQKWHQEIFQNSAFKEINLGIDPYSLGLWQSQLFKSHLSKEHFNKAAEKKARIFRLSSLAYRICGSSPSQDLAILLSSLLQVYRDYEGEVPKEELAHTISFEIAIGSNLFENLGFLSAFKTLVDRVHEVIEIENHDIEFFTVPDVRALACREPWNNILRLTAMHSAALMSGAKAHVSLPFDLFSKADGGRVARNITEILRRESHLNKLSNPTQGSFFEQEKADQFCNEAWALFQEIENKEGLRACLRSGWLHSQIQEYQKSQTQKFLTREKKMTGVNQYVLKKSLNKEYPLVEKDEKVSLENWWATWMNLDSAENLCQVERYVPHSLVSCFEKWQFKGDEWNAKQPDSCEIPVLVESSQVMAKKWGAVSEFFGLAALGIKELKLENLGEEALVVVLAGDPEGEFVKKVFKDTPEKLHPHLVWGGEKRVEPFSYCLNPKQPIDEFFQFVFRQLEDSL